MISQHLNTENTFHIRLNMPLLVSNSGVGQALAHPIKINESIHNKKQLISLHWIAL